MKRNVGKARIGRGPKSLLLYSAAAFSRRTNSIRPLLPSSFIPYLRIYPFICHSSSHHPSTPHLMTLPWVRLQLRMPVHPSYISLAHRHLPSRTHESIPFPLLWFLFRGMAIRRSAYLYHISYITFFWRKYSSAMNTTRRNPATTTFLLTFLSTTTLPHD